MPNISFYLQQNSSGTVLVLTGTWVRLTNNNTATTYVSTAASDSNGLVTFNSVPAGTYTVATGPTNVGAWTNTGDNNFTVNETDSSNITTVPGTLVVTGETSGPDYKSTGVASLGNARSSRFIGSWTTVGAPTGLTAQVADYGFDGNFNQWVCTVAGTPGTWRPFGKHLISKTTLANGVANPSISIPAGYDGMEIWVSARDNGVGTTFAGLNLTFNNDATGIYDQQVIQSVGGAAPTGPELYNQTSANMGFVVNGGAAASMFAENRIELPNYADTSRFKKVIFAANGEYVVGTGANATKSGSGIYRSTNAISSVQLLYTPGANNIARVYGY